MLYTEILERHLKSFIESTGAENVVFIVGCAIKTGLLLEYVDKVKGAQIREGEPVRFRGHLVEKSAAIDQNAVYVLTLSQYEQLKPFLDEL